jgi:hypothetical protein
MLEEVLTLALMLSIATHALLVKKCQSLETYIPIQTGAVHDGIAEVKDLLDEALDLMAGLIPAQAEMMAVPNASKSLPDLILNTLLSRMGMAEGDGSPTHPQDWEILPPDDDPTTTQDDQPFPSGTAVPNR